MIETFRFWLAKAFNSSILEKKRAIWVDYLRGLVIILVVYHHTFLGMERSGMNVPKSVGDANMVFYSFRMPLFFIVSGIFTSLSLNSKSIKKIVWGKFNLLLYPYLIWSFLQISLQIALSQYTNSDRNPYDYLYILYQPKHLDQFWYLPALFNATIAYIFIKTKLKANLAANFLLGIFFFLAGPFINNISLMSNWMRFYIFFVIGDSLSVFILKAEVQARLKKPLYFLAFIPVFIAAQYYYFHDIGVRSLENDSATFDVNYLSYIVNETGFLVTSLVGCGTFILFAFLLEKWNRMKWLRIIGFHSLYIYIMHVMIVAFIRMLFNKFFGINDYLIILLIGISFGVTLPVIFYNLLGRKYCWFLFTTKTPKQIPDVNQQNLVEKHSLPVQ